MSQFTARHQLGWTFLLLMLAGEIYSQEVAAPKNHVEQQRIDVLTSELAMVSLADGISEGEAKTLIRIYSELFIGCGGLVDVTDSGDHWLVVGFVRRGAEEVHGFKIMKNTGEIISTVGPSFKEYSKMIW